MLKLEFFTYVVEHTPTFLQNLSDNRSAPPKKVIVARSYINFMLFAPAYLGGAISHYRQKTKLEWANLTEFLIFLQKKVPGNIAAFRLKIAHSWEPLQPFQPAGCWNLKPLLWQP